MLDPTPNFKHLIIDDRCVHCDIDRNAVKERRAPLNCDARQEHTAKYGSER